VKLDCQNFVVTKNFQKIQIREGSQEAKSQQFSRKITDMVFPGMWRLIERCFFRKKPLSILSKGDLLKFFFSSFQGKFKNSLLKLF